MRIGVPREIKDSENRVALTPAGARALIEAGHAVSIERAAGAGCGFADADYALAGATLTDAGGAWAEELIVKVKEPLESEYPRLRGQILFTYLHLAGVPRVLTDALLASGTTAIAYETVEDAAGRLPLLAPMSAIAGTMAPVMGAYHLARHNGGRGSLLGRVLGQRYGQVTIIGDGVVGEHAAAVASAMGARVCVFGLSETRGAALKAAIGTDLEYRLSTPELVAARVAESDLVIGAVLVEGARAPRVVTEAMVQSMPPGAVIVDVSIDQGGCVATSRPTSHSRPTFVVHDVVHYCVTNMPGAYPRTATLALTDATLPYLRQLADHGLAVLGKQPGFAHGVNTHGGYVTCKAVADALELGDRYRPVSALFD